jgi:hypothetical protein
LAAAVVIVWPVSSNIGDKQQSDKVALADSQMNALLTGEYRKPVQHSISATADKGLRNPGADHALSYCRGT